LSARLAPYAAPAEGFFRNGGPLIVFRVVFALLVAALVVLIGGPIRWFALRCGWTFGESLPILLHRILCLGLGVTLRAHGSASAMRPQLVVPNHVSWLDIIVLGAVRPLEFLAKKEVGEQFFGRLLVGLQGAVYVDRGRRFKIPAVNAEMAKRMRAGAAVVLFAEATTNDGNRVLRFRSSHFEASRIAIGPDGPLHSSIIQPIFIAYSRRSGLPLGRADRPFVAWYGDMRFFSHLWRFLLAGRVDCDIYFGAPIYAHRGHHRKELARRTERAVRALAEQARQTPARP
jgi:1-acyl-sn-glycerol-3-phosphate acyltransferase